ncbi:MAG: hypothetical protein R2705_11890 [Ilumatobacteraceae bacterium]
MVPGLALAAVGLRSLFPSGWLQARTGVPATISCRLLAAVTFMGVDNFVPLAADRVHHVGAIAQGLCHHRCRTHLVRRPGCGRPGSTAGSGRPRWSGSGSPSSPSVRWQ